jgi:hypothetical protein
VIGAVRIKNEKCITKFPAAAPGLCIPIPGGVGKSSSLFRDKKLFAPMIEDPHRARSSAAPGFYELAGLRFGAPRADLIDGASV